MKNTRETQLKKAIFLTEDEFTDIFGRKYDVYFDSGFVQVFDESGESIDFIPVLSEHFGVEVTSVHTDGCDIFGVWVVYKENEKIVRLDIVDNQPETESERILATFYLVNPDEKKITLLQNKMKARFNEDDEFYDEKFADDFSAIYTFIKENFSSLNINSMEVEW